MPSDNPQAPSGKILGFHSCPWRMLPSICWDLSLGVPHPRTSHGVPASSWCWEPQHTPAPTAQAREVALIPDGRLPHHRSHTQPASLPLQCSQVHTVFSFSAATSYNSFLKPSLPFFLFTYFFLILPPFILCTETRKVFPKHRAGQIISCLEVIYVLPIPP